MTLQIGRVGLSDPQLEDPETWEHSGEQVTVTGDAVGTSVVAAKALRQQLLGLADNPDEPVVPVVWDQDDFVDGFYRVTGVSVGTVPVSLSAAWFPFSVELERVSDYAAPLIESVLLAPGARANDYSETAVLTNHALPATATGYDIPGFSTSQTASYFTATSEDGDIDLFQMVQINSAFDYSAFYNLPPGDWYVGASRFEVDYGNGYETVVGRQVVGSPDWRISNGMLRVHPPSGSDMDIGLSRWDGSAWTTIKRFDVGDRDSGSWSVISDPDNVAILRNTPESVVVRLAGFYGGKRTTLDIELRRGDNTAHLHVFISVDTGVLSPQWFVGRSSTEAGEDIDEATVSGDVVGTMATSADADGIVYFVCTNKDSTNDNTNGRTYIDVAAFEAFFGVGLVDNNIDYDPAGVQEPADNAARRWLNPVGETIRAVEL